MTAGLRYETGVDWYAYSNLFDDTPSINQIGNPDGRSAIFSTIDYGYALFNSITKYLGGSIQTVFFIMSFFTSLLLYKGLKTYMKFDTISLLVYFSLLFFILDMSGIRQGLALSIFFYSIRYIYERKFVKYLLLILFAASFHWSAYFLIPIYFILTRYYSSLRVVIFFLVAIVIFVLNIHWLELLITKLFPSVENAILSARLLSYTTNTYAASREFNRGTLISIIFYIFTFAFALYYRKALENRFKYFNVFFNIYLCQIFTFFCMYEFVEMADRLRLYFLIANLIILPSFIYLFHIKTERLVCFIYIFLFSLFSCQPWILSSPMTIAYSPYQNYLVYKIFGVKSTGYERLQKQSQVHD